MLSTGRTWHAVLRDEILHLLIAPSIHAAVKLNAVLLSKLLNELISTETLMTLLTIHQWIGKTSKMTGCNPCLWVHKNCTVNADIVLALTNKLLPPCLLYIVLQFYTEITIIPCVRKSAINLRSRIDKTSCLCECLNLLHCFFHDYPPFHRCVPTIKLFLNIPLS